MKKNTCLIVGTILLIFVWTNTCFAADKIGFVNLREVFQNSTAGKKAGEDLKKLADKKQEGIKTMENEVKKMKDELEKQSSVMTASARSDKEAAYQRKLRDYQILVDDANKELQKHDQEYAAKIVPEIAKVIRSIGEKEKYTVILDNTQVLYYDKANDISKRVIEDYNKVQNTKK